MMSEETRVRDVMSSDVVTVTATTTVAEFLELARRGEISGAPVVGGDGRVLGVVSLTDVLRTLRGDAVSALDGEEGDSASPEPAGATADFFRVTEGGPPVPAPEVITRRADGESGVERTVDEIMTRAKISIGSHVEIGEAAAFLERAGVHRALVFEGSRLVGIVTTHDLLGALLAEE